MSFSVPALDGPRQAPSSGLGLSSDGGQQVEQRSPEECRKQDSQQDPRTQRDARQSGEFRTQCRRCWQIKLVNHNFCLLSSNRLFDLWVLLKYFL